MTSQDALYEVEVRCHFNDADEVYQTLPFLNSCLEHEATWVTAFYGLELFQSGQLLRAGEAVIDKETRHFLGWKGPDIGKFANIRQELHEEITSGITNSAILKHLGGNDNVGSSDEVIQELERLGYDRFMSFGGIDLTGYYEPYGISLKLMNCEMLKWPLLVEIEKTANNEEEAIRCEEALRKLCGQFQLQGRLVREEPPSLLYDSLFNPDSK